MNQEHTLDLKELVELGIITNEETDEILELIKRHEIMEAYQKRVASFSPLSKEELKKLTIDELVEYKKRERAYNLENQNYVPYHYTRTLFHPVLVSFLRGYHGFKKCIKEIHGKVPKTNRPIIFSVSHIGMYDVEMCLQAIKKQAYLFAGDEECMYRTLDGFLFEWAGVIYVMPEDKVDSFVGAKTIEKYLKMGKNVFMTPECTWNLTENYPTLPLRSKIIELAYNSNALILPVAIDQRDLDNKIDFIVNIGSFFDVREQLGTDLLCTSVKHKLAEDLRSEMSRLKVDTWENISRSSIDQDYYERFLERRFNEWPYCSLDNIKSRMFDPRDITKETEVFAHLNEIEIGTHNAFLARTRKKYNDYHRKDVF